MNMLAYYLISQSAVGGGGSIGITLIALPYRPPSAPVAFRQCLSQSAVGGGSSNLKSKTSICNSSLPHAPATVTRTKRSYPVQDPKR